MNYNNGLNNFDIVYYINLKHRTDRLEHINNELSKTNIDKNKIIRIDGVYYKTFGSLGCVNSHIKALEAFINSPDHIKNCIILEDDFIFTEDQENINLLIDNFFNKSIPYDVLMLSGNILNSCKTEYSFLEKIVDAQTTSGYCINKNYAPILLNNFKESKFMLEIIGHKVHCFSCDIHMKKLQLIHNWYCINPKIGKQIKSFSDIENDIVNYDC